MKTPDFLLRLAANPPVTNPPPVGCVDLKYSPAAGSFVQVNANGSETTIGGTPSSAVEYVTESGTEVILSSVHLGKIVILTSSSPVEVLTADGLSDGFNCGFIRQGTGTVEFVEGGAGAINSAGGLLFLGDRYSTASICKLPDGSFNLSGSLA